MFDFEDLLGQWKTKLQASSRDVVSRYIAKQVITYTRLSPLLQKVRGEIFERDHWRALFTMLGLPSNTLPTLTLAHFLSKAELMTRCRQKITELAARAQGEVTIREAVQELKLWAETCEFELLEHKTFSGINTVLIKGWKDLFTHVSDKQALVGNLKDSPFFGPFRDQATQIEIKLNLLDNVLMTLNLVQRKWVSYTHFSYYLLSLSLGCTVINLMTLLTLYRCTWSPSSAGVPCLRSRSASVVSIRASVASSTRSTTIPKSLH